MEKRKKPFDEAQQETGKANTKLQQLLGALAKA
jgi:hypothetical protein